MRMDEETELVLNFAREFAEKDVAPAAALIEESGIPGELLAKAAERGYLGAVAPEDLGGASLGPAPYMALLETLASSSPSVAFYIMLQNSLVIAPLLGFRGSEEAEAAVRSVADGTGSGTLLFGELLSNAQAGGLKLAGGHLVGSCRYVVHPSADFFISESQDGGLLLVRGGGSRKDSYPRLGMRGVEFCSMEFETSPAHYTLIGRKGGWSMASTLNSASRAIAATALGIAEGALSRAVRYAAERKTFGSELRKYQPVAHALSMMQAELESMKAYLYGSAAGDAREALAAKLLLTDAAVRASRLSMQVHGGNGYFSDYGVEKYYRDAMALEALGGNRNDDLKLLSGLILGEGSASI